LASIHGEDRFLREAVFEKVGRVHPTDEVEGIGGKVNVEVGEGE
jgi:hypothetical protein